MVESDIHMPGAPARPGLAVGTIVASLKNGFLTQEVNCFDLNGLIGLIG
jgi:hypothetical protein